MKYFYSRELEGSVEDLVLKIREELQKEGFGILTDVNVKELFKEKINVDFRKYRILGACNPVCSHKALRDEGNVGVMLPCNIIVQEKENGLTEVAAIDPVASMLAINNDPLKEVAAWIGEKLTLVVDRL